MRQIALLGLLVLPACDNDVGKLDGGDDGGGSLDALVADAIVPDQGPTGGGTSVTVQGEGFTEGVVVSIGGEPCGSLTVLSAVELACVTPAGPAGTRTVELTRTEDGATASIAFTYIAEGDEGGDDDGGDDEGDDGTGDDSGDDGTGDDSGDDGGTGDDSGDDGGTGGDTGTEPIPVDYCHIQWPCSQTVNAGLSSEPVYVWVYEAGVTEGSGQGAGMTVEIGVGPDGSSPGGSWAWTPATYNIDQDGLNPGDKANDEYQGSFTAPATSGSYDYAARVSADGGVSWTSCDLGGNTCGGQGSTDGYDPGQSGTLTVPSR